jgi:hypothetical protein
MAQQMHVLIDAATSIVYDKEMYGGGSTAGRPGWNAFMRECRGRRSEGVHVVALDNGVMTVEVLPTRGMGVRRVRRGEKMLGWQAPAREPVHPSFVPLMEPAGLGWLDGFNELLCRCGLESNGPPEFDDAGRLLRPLHGRIANTPAHRVELIVDEELGQLTLRGVVDEARFHFQALRLTTSISTFIGSNEFSWSDAVTNIGGREAQMQMLYHFNIGQPLLRPGARISAPIATVAPLTDVAANEGIDKWNIMPPPRPGSVEQVYVLDLAADENDDTRVMVSGLTDDEAVSLRFSKSTLPCLTVWRNTPAEADGYVVGIEPGTNYPNPRTFEKMHGRVVVLKPGETWRAGVTATWHSEAASIAKEEEAIRAIQCKRTANMVTNPVKDWSAGA